MVVAYDMQQVTCTASHSMPWPGWALMCRSVPRVGAGAHGLVLQSPSAAQQGVVPAAHLPAHVLVPAAMLQPLLVRVRLHHQVRQALHAQHQSQQAVQGQVRHQHLRQGTCSGRHAMMWGSPCTGGLHTSMGQSTSKLAVEYLYLLAAGRWHTTSWHVHSLTP